jgi:hypothetical protein
MRAPGLLMAACALLLPPYPDGTRVTRLLFFDRRQWPGDPATGPFSAERMAQALRALEK